MTEAVIYNRMANDGYKMRFYNDIVWIYEYRSDGLTKAGNSLFVSIFPLSPTLLCATSTRALLYLFLLINAPNVCIEINALIITTGAPIHSAMTLVLYLPIKSHEKV